MATHSSILAWRIPWMEEPGRLQVHGVTEGRTQLSDFTFTFHFHALEKEMATHSSVFAWRIPGMGEPGGLPFMGLHRVGHDWSDLAVAGIKRDFPGSSNGKESACNAGGPQFNPCIGKIAWRREWLPTSAFLPGESHRQRSLVSYSPWDRKESDMTERLTLSHFHIQSCVAKRSHC